ncbi:MAG: hypothetical protein PHE67_10455 [Campylobacterales bacterium]|nr:hypothetical protein [Campylobacterales bacterium]
MWSIEPSKVEWLLLRGFLVSAARRLLALEPLMVHRPHTKGIHMKTFIMVATILISLVTVLPAVSETMQNLKAKTSETNMYVKMLNNKGA